MNLTEVSIALKVCRNQFLRGQDGKKIILDGASLYTVPLINHCQPTQRCSGRELDQMCPRAIYDNFASAEECRHVMGAVSCQQYSLLRTMTSEHAFAPLCIYVYV